MVVRLSALRAGRTLPLGFFIFKDSWCSFLLEAESTPGPVPVRPEGLGQLKNPPNWDLNPRPSGLQHSGLATTLPRPPILFLILRYSFH
jgi:hypothetical protein